MPVKVLCVDIGGSKMIVGVMDADGKILTSRRTQLQKPDKEQLAELLVCACRQVLDEAGEGVVAIGVAIPGLVDSEKGMWVYAPFSKISQFPIAQLLQEAFGLPVFIENDGNICVIGERRFGLGKTVDDYLWVTISNGVGGGILLGGQLFKGTGGNAGEIGHIKVVDSGRRCGCGGNGCLEAYAAGPGISQTYRERTGSQLTAEQIARALQAGDPEALATYELEGLYLGKAIAAAVNLLNVPLVVLGGGVSGSFSLFEGSLQRALKQYLFASGNPNLQVLPTALGYHACLIGTGAHALNGLGV